MNEKNISIFGFKECDPELEIVLRKRLTAIIQEGFKEGYEQINFLFSQLNSFNLQINRIVNSLAKLYPNIKVYFCFEHDNGEEIETFIEQFHFDELLTCKFSKDGCYCDYTLIKESQLVILQNVVDSDDYTLVRRFCSVMGKKIILF